MMEDRFVEAIEALFVARHNYEGNPGSYFDSLESARIEMKEVVQELLDRIPLEDV